MKKGTSSPADILGLAREELKKTTEAETGDRAAAAARQAVDCARVAAACLARGRIPGLRRGRPWRREGG